MIETMPHIINRIDEMGRPYTPFPARDVPRTRVNALSILRAAGDDPEVLTEAQRQAIRKLYRIDGDERSIQDLVEAGEIVP